MSGDEQASLWRDRGWMFGVARLRLDLLRLVTAVFAFKARGANWGAPLLDLVDEFGREEIDHLLISVAAMTRVLLDQQSPRRRETRAKCGVLSPDTSDEKPLALREACNKVLHAEVRNFEWVSDFGSEIPELSGEVYLSGEQPNGPWKARLDIVGFVTAVASLTGGGSDEAEPAGE